MLGADLFVALLIIAARPQHVAGAVEPQPRQLLGGGFLSNSPATAPIGRIVAAVSEGVRSQLVRPDSPLSQFSRELETIFEQNQTVENRPEAPIEETSPAVVERRHHLRLVDPKNPFDLTKLAEEMEEFDVIKMNSTAPRGGGYLGEFFSSGFDVVLGMLNAQQKVAEMRKADPVPRRLDEIPTLEERLDSSQMLWVGSPDSLVLQSLERAGCAVEATENILDYAESIGSILVVPESREVIESSVGRLPESSVGRLFFLPELSPEALAHLCEGQDHPTSSPARQLQANLSGLFGVSARNLLGRFPLFNQVLGAPSSPMHAAPPSIDAISSPNLPGDSSPRPGSAITEEQRRSLRSKYGADVEIEQSDACFLMDAEIVGENFLVVRSQDIGYCQNLCKNSPRCKYVTMRKDEDLCYQYSNVSSLQNRKSAISAPKHCAGDEPPTHRVDPVHVESADSGEETGRVVSQEQLGGLPALGPAMGLLGSLGGGLGNGGLGGALSAASSVMTTGSQLMQALPLKELAAAGMQLADSGYLRNRGVRSSGGARNRDKSSLPPPPGAGSPSVTCRVEGMTCCVPRQAVPDWQQHPPFLNQYNTPECQSVYIPNQDLMCATSSYDGSSDEERCGIILTDTSDLQIYKHILTLPARGINNAICECYRKSSSALDVGIKGAARWEFSLAAVDSINQKKNETEATAQKLVRGANAAVALTQLLGQQQQQQQSTTSFLTMPQRGMSEAAPGKIQNAGNAVAALGNAVNLVGTLSGAMGRARNAR